MFRMKLIDVLQDKNSLREYFLLLSNTDRRKLLQISLIQISMGFLDLLGITLLGIVGNLAINNQNSTAGENSIIHEFLFVLNLNTFQEQSIFLVTAAITILIGRTLLSALFTNRILRFFSSRGSQISANLVRKLLAQNIIFIKSRNIQEHVYAITDGVTFIVIQILATSIVLLSDISLLVILTFTLFFLNPLTALVLGIYFVIMNFFLHRTLNLKATFLGKKIAEVDLKSKNRIFEALNSFREITLQNSRNIFAEDIAQNRHELSLYSSEFAFMPYINKYVIEISIIIAALIVSASQLYLQDSSKALATLIIFLAAGSRIAPAVLRIQQGSIQIMNAIGAASKTFALIESLKYTEKLKICERKLKFDHVDFEPSIRISNLNYRYPSSNNNAISNLNLEISGGEKIAIVGPSGSGKTTLVDLMLGILPVEFGEITISNLSPGAAINRWPGAIAYVPQEVHLIAGTLLDNLLLGFEYKTDYDQKINLALEFAALDQVVKKLPNGLQSIIGETGISLSGGERQRIGIARAILTSPKILILDEATSALDSETEKIISESISKLGASVTLVVIAHRLSTIREIDRIIYVQNGEVLAEETL